MQFDAMRCDAMQCNAMLGKKNSQNDRGTDKHQAQTGCRPNCFCQPIDRLLNSIVQSIAILL